MLVTRPLLVPLEIPDQPANNGVYHDIGSPHPLALHMDPVTGLNPVTALHLLGTYGRPPAGSVGLALSAGHTHVSGGVTQQWQRDGGGASEEKPCMMCYSE